MTNAVLGESPHVPGHWFLIAVAVVSGALVHGAEIDSTPQMQARLAAVPDGGTLEVEKGVYHFFGDHARMMWLDPSNNQSGEKQVVSVVPDPAGRLACAVLVDADLPSTVKEGVLAENTTLNPDVTIRGNTIEDCGGLLFGLSGWRGNEPGLPKIHGRVHLAGNVFKNVRGGKWSPVGARDFSAR